MESADNFHQIFECNSFPKSDLGTEILFRNQLYYRERLIETNSSIRTLKIHLN